MIDSLTHITEDSRWFDTGLDCSVARLLREMDASSVERSVVAALPSDENNRYVLAACRDNADRLMPVAGVNPLDFRDEEQARSVVQTFADDGFWGLKIHPRLTRCHPGCRESNWVYAAAMEQSMPVYLCTVFGGQCPPLGRPGWDCVHQVCVDHPCLKLVLLHAGWWDVLAFSEVIRSFENVLMDLSAVMLRFRDTSVAQDIAHLIRTFDRRLVLGSDFPEFTIAETLEVFGGLSEGCSPSKIDNILRANMHRLML